MSKEKIIQITSGRGPAECAWVVAKLLKVFLSDVKSFGFEYKVISRVAGQEAGTLLSASISLKGKNTDEFLSAWEGSIQWIGKSMFRKYHKRKNWFVGLKSFSLTKVNSLHEKDIKFQTLRSSGPGGQHVNKTESAVRATHITTGIAVLVQDSRSQHQNKKIAIQRLSDKFQEIRIKQLVQEFETSWSQHNSLQRGNPVRVFYDINFKEKK